MIAAAVICISFLVRSRQAAISILGSEKLLEITYQFLLVTILGGAIALLYKQVEHRHEQRRAQREMYTELLAAFNQAKSVRRQLRARLGTTKSINPNTQITADEYEKQMEALSKAQLILEIHAKRAEDPALWFLGGRIKLAKPLRKVECYLNEILKEYQRELSQFSGSPPTKPVAQLDKLSEFIGPYKKAVNFQDCLKYPIRDALQALGRVILR